MSDKKTVVITGATGYLAGFTVKLFLEAGHNVRATVRNPDPSNKQLDFLRNMQESEAVKKAEGKLTFYKADLLKPETFAEPFEGADILVHMAAVVGNSVPGTNDPWAVIRPGVDGAKNVGIAATKAKIPRMVYTSSVAAIIQKDNERHPDKRGKLFDEEEWRLDCRPAYAPYETEKTQSEIVLKENYFGELICINPSLVIGPLLEPTVRSSMEVMRLIANREYPFCPAMRIPGVDVRDVAKAHFCGAFTKLPEGFRHRRFIISLQEQTSCTELSQITKKLFPHLNPPSMTMPASVAGLLKYVDARMSPCGGDEYPTVRPGMNNTRSKTELDGFSYDYSLEDAVKASVESFMEYGITPKPPAPKA